MKIYTNTLNPSSEYYLSQKIDRLEATIYKIKNSLLKWGIGLAFILAISEGLVVYILFHS